VGGDGEGTKLIELWFPLMKERWFAGTEKRSASRWENSLRIDGDGSPGWFERKEGERQKGISQHAQREKGLLKIPTSSLVADQENVSGWGLTKARCCGTN